MYFFPRGCCFFCNTLTKFTFPLRLFDKFAILSAFRWRNLHFFLKIYDETYAFINIRWRNSCFFGTPLKKPLFSEIFWRDLDFFAFFWDVKMHLFTREFMTKVVFFCTNRWWIWWFFLWMTKWFFLATISQIMRYFFCDNAPKMLIVLIMNNHWHKGYRS